MEEGRMRLPRCVSFQSKLIAVETITLERPPDHSITTLYRHRPRPSVITVWQPDGKRPGPASPIKLYRVVCVYVYIFSLVIHPFSLSLLSRFSFASFSISSGAGWNRWRERHTIVIGGCATTYRLFRGINSFHYDIPVINRECFVVRIFIGSSSTRKRPILQRDLLLYVFEKWSYSIGSSIMLFVSFFLLTWCFSARFWLRECQLSRTVTNYKLKGMGRRTGVDSNKRRLLADIFFLFFAASLEDNNLRWSENYGGVEKEEEEKKRVKGERGYIVVSRRLF